MTDPSSGPAPRCPWCSAALPGGGIEQCPSCGAQLVTVQGAETDIRGVTTLDAEAILRARSELNRPRTRLLSLITGDEAEAASAREHQTSLAQPSSDVRREMARLEAEARRAEDEAERTALRAAAMAELGITVEQLAAAEAGDPGAADMAGGIAAHPGEPSAEHPAGPPPSGDLDPGAVESADDAGSEWPAELHPPEATPLEDEPAAGHPGA